MSISIPVVVKFEQSAEQTFEFTKRIVGLVKARHLAHLITVADLESNPRSSKVGPITEAITDSLDVTPEIFPAKSKGLLIATATYRPRERQRYELEFVNPLVEGILDGGHNALALGLHILRCAEVDPKAISRVKLWPDFKALWNTNLENVNRAVRNSDLERLDILVPVEILVPADPDDTAIVEGFGAALLDICTARNNNAQLTAGTQANQRGYFEALKEILPPEIADEVEWKTNLGGRIKSADIVALSWIPLALISLPIDEDGRQVEAPAPQGIYSSKGDCVTRFERLMSSHEVSKEGPDGYRRDLVSESVRSAFEIVPAVLKLYDLIYSGLPRAYNSNDGKFRRINAVKKMNPEGSSRKKYTKFTYKEVDTAIPEGFVVPLVVGLRSLMTVTDGHVAWKTDPFAFIEQHFETVVGEFKSAMALLEYDPQKVGKSPAAYRMAATAYEMVLLRAGQQ